MQQSSTDPTTTLVDDIADWLVTQALGDQTLERTFAGCCERLRAAGIPLWRGQVAFRTIHPLWDTVELTWYPGHDLDTVEYPEGESQEAFQESPFAYLIRSEVPMLRRRLTGENATLDFPILHRFAQAGATDYLAFVIPFGQPDGDAGQAGGMAGSWATDRAGGFSDDDLRGLQRIQRQLALACKVSVKQQIARNIATAYLGESAGRQVLDGRIRRGDGEQIHAVIWFCDLRRSTRLAEQLPLPQFLAAVNGFFECMAGAVLAHEGEVLRFVGDAVLAIFPMELHAVDDPRTCPVHRRACRAALAAAREALDDMETLNERRGAAGDERLEFGIALHVGDVMYGNIGAPRRLEFSVIGAAVNQAARLEGLCKSLGQSLVVSADVASIVDEDLAPLGMYTLEGVPGSHEVYGLPKAGVAS